MSYTPPLFADIGKKTKDLFKKKYSTDNSLIVKHKNKRNADHALSVETRGNVRDCGSVDGEARVVCEGTLSGYAHTIELEGTTCGRVGGSLEVREVAPNVTIQVCGGVCGGSRGACGDKKSCDNKKSCEGKDAAACNASGNCSVSACLANLSGGVEATYRRDAFAGSLAACYKQKPHVSASAVVGSNGLSVGGSVSADPVNVTVSCYGAAVQYEHKDIVLSLLSEKKLTHHTLSAFHPVNPNYTVGFQYTFDSEAKCATKARALCAGIEYNASIDTVVKAKASTGGCASLSVEHRLTSPNVLLAFTSGFSLPKSGDGLSADKFGLQLTLGDI